MRCFNCKEQLGVHPTEEVTSGDLDQVIMHKTSTGTGSAKKRYYCSTECFIEYND